MARPCTVCLHPEVAAIDALLADRRSATSVAAGFGLGPDAVTRHARGHLGRRRAVISMPINGAAVSDPLAELVAALRMRALAGDAAAAREYRLALAAQTAAHHASAPPVDLSTTAEWVRLRALILEALEPFPEARTAVASALGSK